MVTREDLIQKKKELKLSCREISEWSSIPMGTVQKVFSGATENPRRETLLKIAEALYALEKKSDSYEKTPEKPAFIKEPSYVYGTSPAAANALWPDKRQGEYTVEDYLMLPDDQRYELIDGVLYDMASPTLGHQDVAGYLYYQFMKYVEEHDLPCRPYIAPLDVQIDRDNRTMVQPDVMVCCDHEVNKGPRIFGAPDFVAEVLSPSTSNRDLVIKLKKYFTAGVREYWILDPVKKIVTVYVFGPETTPVVYSFEDSIPVTISNGLCTISMKGILKRLG